MYIELFNQFMYQAQELYVRDPQKVRLTMKYRHVDGKLVVKVTDDRVCLKFRTDQASDVKRVEKLSKWFFAQATSKRPRMETDDSEVSAEEASQQPKKKKTGGTPKRPNKRRKGKS